MSYAGLLAVTKGIGAQEDTTNQAQISTGLFLLDLIYSSFELSKEWMKILSQDADDVYAAALDYDHPSLVAAATGKKNVDTNLSDLDTSKLTTLVESQKSEADVLGTNLEQTYNMQEPVNNLLGLITGSLNRY